MAANLLNREFTAPAPDTKWVSDITGEWTDRHSYQTRQEAQQSIFEYIEAFYHRQRRHSSLDYLDWLVLILGRYHALHNGFLRLVYL